MKELSIGFGLFTFLGILFLGLSLTMSLKMNQKLQVEAVRSGAAKWVVSETGATTFTWKHLEEQ